MLLSFRSGVVRGLLVPLSPLISGRLLHVRPWWNGLACWQEREGRLVSLYRLLVFRFFYKFFRQLLGVVRGLRDPLSPLISGVASSLNFALSFDVGVLLWWPLEPRLSNMVLY